MASKIFRGRYPGLIDPNFPRGTPTVCGFPFGLRFSHSRSFLRVSLLFRE
jgi:hypothetical protein